MAKNDTSQAINCIAESLRLYTLVLNQKNSNIIKCEDSLAKCFAATGKTIIKIIWNILIFYHLNFEHDIIDY